VDAFVAEGLLEGRIARGKRGVSGFGYDPLFEIPAVGLTLAEMGTEAKNRISHRYRALMEIREIILRWEIAGDAG
jgi:XTP/dITP diphosphohydrolase